MMNFEINNVSVSLEPLDVSKIKIDIRPPISKPRNSKTRVAENGENAPHSSMATHTETDQSKTGDSVSCKPLDSLENITNGRSSIERLTEEPKLVKEDSPETRHLKDLLLLHLDLIQQQQDLMVMKDHQISQLKQENNTLKCRLERMERRMSILKGVTPSKINSTLPQSPSSVLKESPQKAIKRKNSLEPQSLARKFAKIARNEYDKESRLQGQIRRHSTSSTTRLNKHKQGRRKAFNRLSLGGRHVTLDKRKKQTNSRLSTPTRNTVVKTESSSHVDSDPESHWISRTLRNRNLTSSGVVIPTTPHKTQLIVRDEDTDTAPSVSESRKYTPSKRTDSKLSSKLLRSEDTKAGNTTPVLSKSKRRPHANLPKDCSIMKTGLMYYVPDLDVCERETISPRKPTEDHVIVPSFRIKKFTPYYVIEGTENYDDEVFGKRHQKHELEEKKRKRWDLQRQREQEQLQKLQQKQNGQTDEQDEGTPETLLPDTDRIEFIEVSEEIPVSVFGVPIPKINHRDFVVPWFDRERRERQEARKYCKSRRR